MRLRISSAAESSVRFTYSASFGSPNMEDCDISSLLLMDVERFIHFSKLPPPNYHPLSAHSVGTNLTSTFNPQWHQISHNSLRKGFSLWIKKMDLQALIDIQPDTLPRRKFRVEPRITTCRSGHALSPDVHTDKSSLHVRLSDYIEHARFWVHKRSDKIDERNSPLFESSFSKVVTKTPFSASSNEI